jgi:hypothetical protein
MKLCKRSITFPQTGLLDITKKKLKVDFVLKDDVLQPYRQGDRLTHFSTNGLLPPLQTEDTVPRSLPAEKSPSSHHY